MPKENHLMTSNCTQILTESAYSNAYDTFALRLSRDCALDQRKPKADFPDGADFISFYANGTPGFELMNEQPEHYTLITSASP